MGSGTLNEHELTEIANIDLEIAERQAEQLHQLEKEKLRNYIGHRKQQQFHESQADIRGFAGGNKAGKTFAGAKEILCIVGKVHEYRPNYTGAVTGRACCVTFGALNSVIIPVVRELIPEKPCMLDGSTSEGKPRWWCGLRGGAWASAYNKEEKILYFADGSIIEFKSYDQKQDAFSGNVCHVIWMDEEPPEFIFGENLARQITTPRVNIFFTLTPLNYAQWLYATLKDASVYDGKTTELIMSHAAENPYANAKVLEIIAKSIKDPAEREARLYGEFSFFKGRVWKKYGEHNLHEWVAIPRTWHRILSLDPHPNKPTGVVWAAINPDPDDYPKVVVYREALIEGTAKDAAIEIKKVSRGEEFLDIVMDESSLQQQTTRGVGDLYSQFQKEIPQKITLNKNQTKEATRFNMIDAVKDRLGVGAELRVMENCPITHHQMLNYSWKPPSKNGESPGRPTVVKKNEDLVDCVIQIYQRIEYGVHEMLADKFDGWNVAPYGAEQPEKVEIDNDLITDNDGFGVRMLG